MSFTAALLKDTMKRGLAFLPFPFFFFFLNLPLQPVWPGGKAGKQRDLRFDSVLSFIVIESRFGHGPVCRYRSMVWPSGNALRGW